MLRTFLVALSFLSFVSPASAVKNAYERNLGEFLYKQCVERAVTERRTAHPSQTPEEIRSAAAKDCETRQPPFLKVIDGKTVKERYEQCLNGAMEKHSSTIPPASFQKTRLAAFQSCTDLERLYLGLEPEDTHKADVKRILNEFRSEHLNDDSAKYSIYSLNIGTSTAYLLVAKVHCRDINNSNIDKTLKIMTKTLAALLSVPVNRLFERETLTNPLEELDWELETKGKDAWCAEAREKLEAAGAHDIFLK